jgi:hypothetical protein
MDQPSQQSNSLAHGSPHTQDTNGERTLAKMREGESEAVEMVKAKAGQVIEPIKDQAVNIAEDQKNLGAQKMEGVARAVHEAADKIEEQIPRTGEYVHQVAHSLEEASAALRGRSLGDMLSAMEDFARRQPLAFFGAAVLTGFVFTRFLKSSEQPGAAAAQPTPPATGTGFGP